MGRYEYRKLPVDTLSIIVGKSRRLGKPQTGFALLVAAVLAKDVWDLAIASLRLIGVS